MSLHHALHAIRHLDWIKNEQSWGDCGRNRRLSQRKLGDRRVICMRFCEKSGSRLRPHRTSSLHKATNCSLKPMRSIKRQSLTQTAWTKFTTKTVKVVASTPAKSATSMSLTTYTAWPSV